MGYVAGPVLGCCVGGVNWWRSVCWGVLRFDYFCLYVSAVWVFELFAVICLCGCVWV